jgi:Lipase (class 3)
LGDDLTAPIKQPMHAVAWQKLYEETAMLSIFILIILFNDLMSVLHFIKWAPPGGYGINPQWVHHRRSYDHTHDHAPPYLVYIDHENRDVVLAIRGMNMAKESDYTVLLDNRLGERQFDGGYVHNGLLKAAEWVFESECETMKEILERHNKYSLTFAGHSLGSGVATLLAMVAVQNRSRLGNLERQRIRCFAIAPARCVSLNLAVRYADVINSVVLQVAFLFLKGIGFIVSF